MVPPEGMGVIGVKESVTGTHGKRATRSLKLMMTDNVMFAVDKPPDAVVGAGVVGVPVVGAGVFVGQLRELPAIMLIGPNDSGPLEQHSLL